MTQIMSVNNPLLVLQRVIISVLVAGTYFTVDVIK